MGENKGRSRQRYRFAVYETLKNQRWMNAPAPITYINIYYIYSIVIVKELCHISLKQYPINASDTCTISFHTAITVSVYALFRGQNQIVPGTKCSSAWYKMLKCSEKKVIYTTEMLL